MIIGIIVAIIYLLIGVYITIKGIKLFGKAPSFAYLIINIFWPFIILIVLFHDPASIDELTPTKYFKKFYEYFVDKL